jgi:hypothetical protein
MKGVPDYWLLHARDTQSVDWKVGEDFMVGSIPLRANHSFLLRSFPAFLFPSLLSVVLSTVVLGRSSFAQRAV